MAWLHKLAGFDEERHPGAFMALRLTLAVPMLVLGIFLVGLAGGAGYGAVVLLPLAAAAFIVAGLALAPPIAARWGWRAAGLIFPDRQFDRAQPKYSIPAARRAQGQSEEAFIGFQKISEEFPEAARAYLEMMDIAVRDLGNANLAAAVFHRGVRAVKDPQGRTELVELYNQIRSDFPELPPVTNPPQDDTDRGKSGA